MNQLWERYGLLPAIVVTFLINEVLHTILGKLPENPFVSRLHELTGTLPEEILGIGIMLFLLKYFPFRGAPEAKQDRQEVKDSLRD